MPKRHWTAKDFVVTSTYAAYDGKGGDNRFGYCAVCKADMSSSCDHGKQGPIHHYNSHKDARRLGIWGANR